MASAAAAASTGYCPSTVVGVCRAGRASDASLRTLAMNVSSDSPGGCSPPRGDEVAERAFIVEAFAGPRAAHPTTQLEIRTHSRARTRTEHSLTAILKTVVLRSRQDPQHR